MDENAINYVVDLLRARLERRGDKATIYLDKHEDMLQAFVRLAEKCQELELRCALLEAENKRPPMHWGPNYPLGGSVKYEPKPPDTQFKP